MCLLRKIAVSALSKQAERNICSLFVPAPGVCDGAGSVAAVGLHADRGRAIGVALSIAEGGEGCTGGSADGGAFGAVAAVWLPSLTDFP